ncbi:hypothetical protein BN970_03284 [Mycolicibacterium conceptionense]|uniref:Uncharacterized protein n=1 Tax=Mycolicibacterium conceptionense TaxID=451644 RepID=A0A0U1DG66_9MYCO|nr:hypothetical protein [Mycolicibacterium conceptionense]ORV20072.1 hypothetical protein AWB98_29465 [Mycolicibacterium conceptionense]CQD15651.1 hypothetical protein BN970_03284 [Mycolicibacterium conceptionense]
MLDTILRKLAGYIVAELLDNVDDIAAAIAKAVAEQIDIPGVDVAQLAGQVVERIRALLPGFLR